MKHSNHIRKPNKHISSWLILLTGICLRIIGTFLIGGYVGSLFAISGDLLILIAIVNGIIHLFKTKRLPSHQESREDNISLDEGELVSELIKKPAARPLTNYSKLSKRLSASPVWRLFNTLLIFGLTICLFFAVTNIWNSVVECYTSENNRHGWVPGGSFWRNTEPKGCDVFLNTLGGVLEVIGVVILLILIYFLFKRLAVYVAYGSIRK